MKYIMMILETPWVSDCLCLIFFIIICWLLWRNSQLKSQNEVLVQKNKKIENEILKEQVFERRRVASELHENLNTKMAALRWRLEALDVSDWKQPNVKHLNFLVEMTNQVYDDIRLISHNLLPYELEKEGLSGAIQKLTEEINYSTKIKFHFLSDLSERLSVKVEYECYSVALELVNNIIKHSKATSAWISLSIVTNNLILTVKDNGVGFVKDAQTSGVGLKNLSARVYQLKGQLMIDSSQGTFVQIKVPILTKPADA
jgi:signal transduction histidine kinase